MKWNWNPSFMFLEGPQLQFFFIFTMFIPLCLSLFLSSFCATLTNDCKETMTIMATKLLLPLPSPPKLWQNPHYHYHWFFYLDGLLVRLPHEMEKESLPKTLWMRGVMKLLKERINWCSHYMVNEVKEGLRNNSKGGEWNDMWHNDNFN